ncbi:MAG: alpha/beta hydrolase [Deltaproteobacteria bacterium]|nr:alpha/beta hydrolase [Deltaproteobacteria bacterium]
MSSASQSRIPSSDVTYRVAGSGRDLVLAHGLGGLFHSWSAILPMLARTHRVWEVGFPAFDSDTTAQRRGNSIGDWSEDLARFFDHVGLERAAVIGNSVGGQVATTYAHAHRDRVSALVLLASSGLGENNEGYSLFPGDAVRRLIKRLEEDVVRAILRTVFSADEFFEKELPAIQERLSDRRWKLGLLGTARRVRDATILPLLPQIELPTLLVCGEDDRIVPVRFARAAAPLLPHGELEIFPATGHAPQIERPEQTHDRVLRFLHAAGWN